MKLAIVVIKAPSNLGLRPARKGTVPGVFQFPDALEKTGVFDRIGVDTVKEVAAAEYSPEIDSETGIRNAHAIRDYSIVLADVIEQTIQDKNFPLVIGGDCSILLGATLALRRIGRYGLIFVDGHTDFKRHKHHRRVVPLGWIWHL